MEKTYHFLLLFCDRGKEKTHWTVVRSSFFGVQGAGNWFAHLNRQREFGERFPYDFRGKGYHRPPWAREPASWTEMDELPNPLCSKKRNPTFSLLHLLWNSNACGKCTASLEKTVLPSRAPLSPQAICISAQCLEKWKSNQNWAAFQTFQIGGLGRLEREGWRIER